MFDFIIATKHNFQNSFIYITQDTNFASLDMFIGGWYKLWLVINNFKYFNYNERKEMYFLQIFLQNILKHL